MLATLAVAIKEASKLTVWTLMTSGAFGINVDREDMVGALVSDTTKKSLLRALQREKGGNLYETSL